jgi:transcriptional regulator with XRE-family HTH domain
MINSRKVGATVSRLRKAKNWTQMQLADRMNVTHQAVSRWENGDSLPDIGILTELAQALGISADELLNGELAQALSSEGRLASEKVITALAEGRTEDVARMILDRQAGLDALVEVAPVTPPNLLKGVVENMEGYQFDLKQIVELAPFLDQETLQAVVNELSGPELDLNLLEAIAPHLEPQSLKGYVSRVLDGSLDPEVISVLLPFLEGDEIVDQLAGQAGKGPLESIKPAAFAPFLSEKAYRVMIARFEEGSLSFDELVSMAPFLEGEKLDSLVDRQVGELIAHNQIAALAPFLGEETKARILGKVMDGQMDKKVLSSIAPFIDEKVLSQMVRDWLRRRKETNEAT